MPSPCDHPADLAEFSREFCRLVVRFEQRLRTGAPGTAHPGVTDTPGLGVLVALETFGPLRPTSLATLLVMTTGGATKVIDRVAAPGLVTRTPGTVAGDRRAVVVTITPKGRRALVAAEHALRAIGDDFVRTIDAITRGPAPVPSSESPSSVGTAVGALYRFFALGDPVVIEAVGDAEVLNPNDPRGVLVLLELDHHGALPIAEIPELVDRSRTTVHRLIGRLRDLGLVAVGRDHRDRRVVNVVPTRAGRVMARRVVQSVERHMPELEPALVELAATLRDDDGRGHPSRSNTSARSERSQA